MLLSWFRPLAAGLLLMLGSLAARAQQALGIEPLDQLVVALNQRAVAPLQPYLTPATRVSGLPAAYTAQALAQLVPQLGPVEAIRVVRHEAAGGNVRYVCALTRQGKDTEYTFVLTPDDKFAELNLAPAGRKLPTTTLDAQNLTTPARVELPAQLVNDLLVVQAEVDGRTGAFFFDSGAPALLLNRREFAPAAGQQATPGQGARGVNGAVAEVSSYTVQRFACQGLVLQNQEVATLDMASLEARLGVGKLLGIIGYNLLSDYAVTLDYRAGRIVLQKPTAAGAAPIAGVRVPFVLRGHLPVVEATIDGHTYSLGLDCGAQTNLLDPAAAARLTSKLRHREQVTVRGADAAGRTATTGSIPRLTLAGGQLKFRRQATTFADVGYLSRSLATVPLQGLLGYPLLSQYRTTIDYVHWEAVFEQW